MTQSTDLAIDGVLTDEAMPMSKQERPLDIGFAAALICAYFGAWITVMTPIMVTLPIRVAQISPDTKTVDLSSILGAGAFLAAFVGPIWGQLSDRTRSRLGRRRPWIAASIVLTPLCFAGLALATHIWQLLLAWCAVVLTLNMGQTTMNTCVPDLIPERYRGRVSGFIGLSFPAGLMVGTFFAQVLRQHAELMFLVPLTFYLVGATWLLAVIPDAQVTTARDKLSIRRLVASFWINPFRHVDYGLCWANRFLVVLGYAVFLSYQAYYLMDHLGVSASNVPGMVFRATILSSTATLIACLSAGWLSDKMGRRKPFVAGAVLIMAVGLLLLGTSSTYANYYIGATITGCGEGLYFAVDLALVSAVLPDKLNSGRYMAVMSIASVLPQSLAPAIAPFILRLGGGANYPALFIAATIVSVLGALAVVPIRSSR
jgi:MFS family permease